METGKELQVWREKAREDSVSGTVQPSERLNPKTQRTAILISAWREFCKMPPPNDWWSTNQVHDHCGVRETNGMAAAGDKGTRIFADQRNNMIVIDRVMRTNQ